MTTATVLQEVDPGDLATVLFDYYDPTGANNPGSVKTYFGVGGAFSLDAPGVQVQTSDPANDGQTDLSFSLDELVQTSWRVRMLGTSYDYLRLAIGTLQHLFLDDGVIRWVPAGSSTTFYIHRKPSSLPSLYAGNAGELRDLAVQLHTPQGVPITINRQRYLRQPTLAASLNALANAVMLADADGDGRPDNWAWDSTTGISAHTPYWSLRSYRFTIATTGTRNLQQSTAAATAAPGDVWTFSVYARASGGANCRATAVLEFVKADGTILATATGTQATLSSTETRLSVTSSAAPANTDHVRVNIRMADADATAYTVDLRFAQAEKAATASTFRCGPETVANDIRATNGKGMFVYVPGEFGAYARIALTGDGSSKLVAAVLGAKYESRAVNLAEAVNRQGAAVTTYRTKGRMQDATAYTDTATTADAASTSGTALATSFATVTAMVRRCRVDITPTDAKALQGRWKIFVAMRADTGCTFRVQPHMQTANRDPLAGSDDEIAIDTTDLTTSHYVPLELCEIDFDSDAPDSGWHIEVWAAQDSGSGSLYFDVWYARPADASAGDRFVILEVPGFRHGDQGRETFLGSELVATAQGCVAGSTTPDGDTKVVLNAQYEGVTSAPTQGVVLAAGRHAYTALVRLNEYDLAATTLGRLRIRKAPGPGASVNTWAASHAYVVGDFVKPTGGNANGRTYRCTNAGTSGGSEPGSWSNTDGGTTTSGGAIFTETTVASRKLASVATQTSAKSSVTVAHDADGSTAYQPVVVFTAATAVTTREIEILTIDHEVLRNVDAGYQMQIWADTRSLQTSDGTARVDDLVKEGPFVVLGPGLNWIPVDLWDLPALGYDSADPRDALAKHDPTRTAVVAVDIVMLTAA